MANERGPRQRTAAQLRNDQRMKDKARETREALEATREAQMSAASGETATATLTTSVDGGEQAELVSEVYGASDDETEYIAADDLFGTAAGLFQKASTQGRLSRQDTEQLEGILGRIDPMRNPEIADNAAVQAFIEKMIERKAADPSLRPGELMGTGLAATRKPWTHADVMKRYLACINGESDDRDFMPQTWTPNQTRNIIWNGLGIRVYVDEEVTAPYCYFEIWRNMQIAVRSSQQHVEMLFKSRNAMDPRATDVSIMGPATGRVRGGADGGTYFPGEGGFDVGTDEGDVSKVPAR